MKLEIIRTDGDLKREVWTFILLTDPYRGISGNHIKFDRYQSQYKDNTRQRNWRLSGLWDCMDKREYHSTIQNPPLPIDVENEIREKYSEMVKVLPITR